MSKSKKTQQKLIDTITMGIFFYCEVRKYRRLYEKRPTHKINPFVRCSFQSQSHTTNKPNNTARQGFFFFFNYLFNANALFLEKLYSPGFAAIYIYIFFFILNIGIERQNLI